MLSARKQKLSQKSRKGFCRESLLFQRSAAVAAAQSLKPCLTLCDPIDGSPSGSSVPGILQARILEQVSISFSGACMHAKLFQQCLTLCDPKNSSPPGYSALGILQARILEWVAISFSSLIAKSLLARWNPKGHSPPGPSVHGISQERILEWAAISFSFKGIKEVIKNEQRSQFSNTRVIVLDRDEQGRHYRTLGE